MHETFARWLDDRGEGDELVGTHLERAALDGSALALSREAALRLSRAGARADARLDDPAALSLFERAAALLAPDDPLRLEVDCALGKTLKDLSELPRAVTLLEDVADRSRLADNRRTELRAEVELVWPRLLDGSLPNAAAEELLDEAIAYCGEVGDHLGVARAEYTHSLRLGDFGHQADQAMEHVVKAAAAYSRAGIEGMTIGPEVVFALLGTTTVENAIDLCQRHLNENPDHPRRVAGIRLCLASLRALDDDRESALAWLALARGDFVELGMEVELEVIAAQAAGSIEAYYGEWEAAEATFGRALAYTRERGWTFYRAWGAYFLSRLAETALGRDDPHLAAELAEEAARSLKVDDRLTRIWSRRVLGRAFAATGHPRKAVSMAREAVESARACDDLVEQGEAILDLADVLSDVRRRDEAREAAIEGLALLERKGARLLVNNGRRRFGELLGETDGGARSSSSPADAPINS
jgi:tetratricopeptide (TPR) repeat protein